MQLSNVEHGGWRGPAQYNSHTLQPSTCSCLAKGQNACSAIRTVPLLSHFLPLAGYCACAAVYSQPFTNKYGLWCAEAQEQRRGDRMVPGGRGGKPSPRAVNAPAQPHPRRLYTPTFSGIKNPPSPSGRVRMLGLAPAPAFLFLRLRDRDPSLSSHPQPPQAWS